MGIFKNNDDKSELNAFLGVGTEYRGRLDFTGTVRIDGRFEGEITTDGDLVLGREASITGSVRVGRLTSCGRIEGDVVVEDRALLEKTSVLLGSLTAPSLVVEQGAIIEGGINMTGESGSVATKVVTADFGKSSQPERDGGASREEPVARTGSDDAL